MLPTSRQECGVDISDLLMRGRSCVENAERWGISDSSRSIQLRSAHFERLGRERLWLIGARSGSLWNAGIVVTICSLQVNPGSIEINLCHYGLSNCDCD